MPIQTVMCPECRRTLTADVPIGSRATLTHREGVDKLTISPRIMPITRPTQPVRPVAEPRPGTTREV